MSYKKIIMLLISSFFLIGIIWGGIEINNMKYTRELINAIENNDIRALEDLVNDNKNLNGKPYIFGIDVRNYQALSVAADLGNFDAVKILIENGANVKVTSTNGQTPLHMAIKSLNKPEKYEIIYYLIEHGANINKQNISKNTAIGELLYSDKNKLYDDRFELFKFLLNSGAKIEGSSSYNHILLDAVLNNDVQIVDYLINNYNIDINIQINRLTPLMMTTYRDANEVCLYLVENGADKNIVNNMRETAYDMALKNECIKIIELIKP
jgi:ankyrin repeat protein